MGSASKSQRYIVKSPLIGWTHTQSDRWNWDITKKNTKIYFFQQVKMTVLNKHAEQTKHPRNSPNVCVVDKSWTQYSRGYHTVSTIVADALATQVVKASAAMLVTLFNPYWRGVTKLYSLFFHCGHFFFVIIYVVSTELHSYLACVAATKLHRNLLNINMI